MRLTMEYFFIYAYSPPNPSLMDWTRHYPEFYPAKEGQVQKKVEFADIGCGYGGLLIALAPLFPDTLMLGKWLGGNLKAHRLTVKDRYGDSNKGGRLRVRTYQGIAYPASRILSERIHHANECYEVFAQLFRKGSIDQDVLFVP